MLKKINDRKRRFKIWKEKVDFLIENNLLDKEKIKFIYENATKLLQETNNIYTALENKAILTLNCLTPILIALISIFLIRLQTNLSIMHQNKLIYILFMFIIFCIISIICISRSLALRNYYTGAKKPSSFLQERFCKHNIIKMIRTELFNIENDITNNITNNKSKEKWFYFSFYSLGTGFIFILFLFLFSHFIKRFILFC